MDMPFGKYQGKDIDDIPLGYLRWVHQNVRNITPRLRDCIAKRIGNNDPGPTPQVDVSQYQQRIAELEKTVKEAVHVAEGWKDKAFGLKLEVEDFKDEWKPLFRKLALLLHPDRFGNPDAMSLVNEVNKKINNL